ncbi:MAG: DinB family protein [Acidobacteriia bacterium]|nr:DinB family protein [Terriglobia bacterium]
MPEVAIGVAVGHVLAVLREGFEGPGRWNYFSDRSAVAGLFRTLARVSAGEASRPWGGTSIAAHVHHLTFGLTASTAWIQGDRMPRDWAESWSVSSVDDAAWAGMLEKLRAGYDELRQSVETKAASSAESMGGAIGVIAHVAYHVGAIRQKLACSRQS